jgi:hypothetical protein
MTPVAAKTGLFGYYQFDNLPMGTYTMSVASKRYSFTPSSRSITVDDNLAGVDWIALP